MTDVLGVCTSWGDGVCVDRARVGRTGDDPAGRHRLRQAGPAPPVGAAPRPVVRRRAARAVAVARGRDPAAGRLAAPGGAAVRGPAAAARQLGAGDGRSRECPSPRHCPQIRSFYADRDRPALAQVEAGSTEEAGLVAAGWAPLPDGEADFMIGSVAQVLRHAPALPEDRVVCLTPTSGSSSGTRPVGAEVEIGDRARGRGALDGDWVGIHTVEVAPDHRRQGLATHVICRAARLGSQPRRDDGLAARRDPQRRRDRALRRSRLPHPPHRAVPRLSPLTSRKKGFAPVRPRRRISPAAGGVTTLVRGVARAYGVPTRGRHPKDRRRRCGGTAI